MARSCWHATRDEARPLRLPVPSRCEPSAPRRHRPPRKRRVRRNLVPWNQVDGRGRSSARGSIRPGTSRDGSEGCWRGADPPSIGIRVPGTRSTLDRDRGPRAPRDREQARTKPRRNLAAIRSSRRARQPQRRVSGSSFVHVIVHVTPLTQRIGDQRRVMQTDVCRGLNRPHLYSLTSSSTSSLNSPKPSVSVL